MHNSMTDNIDCLTNERGNIKLILSNWLKSIKDIWKLDSNCNIENN
jgi:hypothetical protein